MLLWEHPIGRALWLFRAVPRVWLSEGETLDVKEASSAYGRLSIHLTSRIDTGKTLSANVTVPTTWCNKGSSPPGGIYLRLRAPDGRQMVRVTIGDILWSQVNTTSETIFVSQQQLTTGDCMQGELQRVVATFR